MAFEPLQTSERTTIIPIDLDAQSSLIRRQPCETMEQFARTIVGYHGCSAPFANAILLGKTTFEQWAPSQNAWDWLGHGIYFWEHAPTRAYRWARERYKKPAVLGAVIQLGRCFDLLDEEITAMLANGFTELCQGYAKRAEALPKNFGLDGKIRKLDCLVINDCLNRLDTQGFHFDTVRGAFLEGEPVYPGAGFAQETHLQIVVRNRACLLGVFRPNL